VLNCVIASLLYERFPHLPEGDLSRLRANLVNQDTLSHIAAALDLGGELLMGEGELKSGGFRRPSILADSLEAVVGAIFLDGGFERAAMAIRGIYAPLLEELDPERLGKDPKTLLQEYLQGRRLPLPQYNVVHVRGESPNNNSRWNASFRSSISALQAKGRAGAARSKAARRPMSWRCGDGASRGAPRRSHLAGRTPERGQSTLLNRLVGQKLSITSTPQTTRHRIIGIVRRAGSAVVFVSILPLQSR
jgi:ribonuclease-3